MLPVFGAAWDIDADRIHVIARHTGGGFGGKGFIWPPESLAAAAARAAGRPVGLQSADKTNSVMSVTSRDGADHPAGGRRERPPRGHRTRREQRGNGRHPCRIGHRGEQYLYAAPSIRTRQIIERVNLNVPTPMRAPVEGPGLWALESAMNDWPTQSR